MVLCGGDGACVWVLYGGDGAVSTGTGLLSAGVGVRLGEAGSLSIAVGVQSARVWVMCGRAGSRACTTGVLSPPRGSTVLFEDRVFSLLASPAPTQMVDKQET